MQHGDGNRSVKKENGSKHKQSAGSGGRPPKKEGVGSSAFTRRVLFGMILGVATGFLLPYILPAAMSNWIQVHVFGLGGDIFIRLLKMLVVPIVFVSLVTGVSSLGDLRQLGRIGGKSLAYYVMTTALAIAIALVLATIIPVGANMVLAKQADFVAPAAPSLQSLLLQIVPTNPVRALVDGDMLQIIFFAILLGAAITSVQTLRRRKLVASGVSIQGIFNSMNDVLMRMITMIMSTAPVGVFLLLANLMMKQGSEVLVGLIGYFFLVLLVLLVQWAGVYSLLLMVFARLNPLIFMRKMYPAMMFAFSVSSSNASIPVVLKTVEERLGVGNAVAAFVIPLGATINMDGTAIMQGVATMFIAHAYNVPLGVIGYLTVIAMATIASVGTAGVPSVGLITLAMVLEQVHLPVQGIAMIIGIDRLLDMVRTAVNISGDAMISCIVAKSEGLLDQDIYSDRLAPQVEKT